MNKKIVIGIVVTIIVIVFAVAGGVIAYRMTRDTSKPEDVLIKYVGYVNEQNYEEMYKLLTNDSKEQISKEDFIDKKVGIWNSEELYKKFTEKTTSKNAILDRVQFMIGILNND